MNAGKKTKRIYAKHPRFGEVPSPSKHNYSVEYIEQSHWHYSGLHYFKDTAIPANIEKQNYSVCPRSLYVDIAEQCAACSRRFIFFAEEQKKYWFETLNFYVDAHCTKCFDCRLKANEVKALVVRYEVLVKKQDRSTVESKELKQIALELHQLGHIKDVSKVNRIKI